MPTLNLVHINIHVADLDRSIAFYSLLGWREMFRLSDGGQGERRSPTFLLKFPPKNEHGGAVVRTSILTLGDDPRCATKLELMQYLEPPTIPKPFQARNEAGVHRLAHRVKDIDAMVRAAGVSIPYDPIDMKSEQLGSRQRYVLFNDPDDNLVELIELFR